MSKCKFEPKENAPRWDDDYRNPKWCGCDACSVALFGEYTIDKHGCRVYKGK